MHASRVDSLDDAAAILAACEDSVEKGYCPIFIRLGANSSRLRTGSFLTAQGQEVLGSFDRLSDFAQEFLQILVAVDKIDV